MILSYIKCTYEETVKEMDIQDIFFPSFIALLQVVVLLWLTLLY
jgi:hypothetical protein